MHPPRDHTKPESYVERVTVRVWDGTKFLNDHKELHAYRVQHAKGNAYVIKLHGATTATPTRSSEIIDAAGTVWVVDHVSHTQHSVICEVHPKKP